MRSSIPLYLENLTFLLCGGLLVLNFVPKASHALTYDREKVKSAMEKAAVVAEVEVESVTKSTDPSFGVRFRAPARIMALERTADRNSALRSGDVVTIVGHGGELNETGVFLPGFPRPRIGKRYHVHLNANPGVAGEYLVVGFENGMTPVTKERAYSRNRTDGSNGDGTGPFLYWDDSFFPIPYYISAPSFRNYPTFITAIDSSLNTWRSVDGTRFEFLPMGCTESTVSGNDGMNQIVYVSHHWELDPLAIAVTRNYYIAGNSARTGLIMDSDILLNGVGYTFSTDNTPNTHDVQNILTHESGHLLGLGHETATLDSDATMYAWAAPNEFNKRQLHANDLAGIRAAYGGTGNRFPGPLSTVNCSLGKPGACLAVHDKPAPRPLEWAIAALLLTAILGMGRWYRRRLT